MPANPYFRIRKNEARLLEDLTVESIAARGFNVVYIPRELVKEDHIFGEDVMSRFASTYLIEAWCENYDAWKGEGDFLSKFGIEIRQGLNLAIAKRRFNQVVGIPHNIPYPRAGDLIYIDFMDRLFEIKHADDDASGMPFFQLGENHLFRIIAELFIYSNETLETGATPIDSVETSWQDPVQLLSLTGGTVDFYGGETLTMGSSAAGYVVHWFDDVSKVEIAGVSGSFVAGATITGVSSGAVYTISSVATGNTYVSKKGYGDNKHIEFEKDSTDLFDFTDEDPFSEGNL